MHAIQFVKHWVMTNLIFQVLLKLSTIIYDSIQLCLVVVLQTNKIDDKKKLHSLLAL